MGDGDGLAIYRLMAAIQSAVAPVAKTERNQQQGYSFRGIAGVAEMLHPLLAKNGVFVLPEVLEEERAEILTSSGKTMQSVHLRVRFTFMAPDGSSVSAVTMGEGADTMDKATNKAMTAAQKYALTLVFTVPFSDQEDGDHISPGERATRDDGASSGRGGAAGASGGAPAAESSPPDRNPMQVEESAFMKPGAVGISQAQAKRAGAIARDVGDKMKCHGFRIITSVLKHGGAPLPPSQCKAGEMYDHLCAHVSRLEYERFVHLIETWNGGGAAEPEEDPPPLGDEDLPF